ncbi:MAG: PaaI family thioesterase [Acidimicrobiia bacterium]
MSNRTAADKALEMTPGSIYSHGCLNLTRLGGGECDEDLEAADWMCDGDGRITAGALVLLADSATGWAVSTVLPAGTTVVTAQLSVQFLRRLEPGERRFAARTRVAHVDPDVSFTRADVLGTSGELVAMATMLGAHVALPADPIGSGAADGALPDGGAMVGSDIDDALGTRLASSHPAGASVEVSALSSLANLTGAVHGGVLSMMVERAIVAALRGVEDDGRLRPLEFDITYHRRIEADGSRIVADADVVEQTRRLVRTVSVVRGVDGRPAAVVRAVHTRPR